MSLAVTSLLFCDDVFTGARVGQPVTTIQSIPYGHNQALPTFDLVREAVSLGCTSQQKRLATSVSFLNRVNNNRDAANKGLIFAE